MGKEKKLNSYDLRSLPAPRCYQRTLLMHRHMPVLLHKNLYRCVTTYINMYCSHSSKHKALEMHTAQKMRKPPSCFAALAGTLASPPALLPLQSPPKTSRHHLCRCKPCKARDCCLLSPSELQSQVSQTQEGRLEQRR